MLSRAWSFHPDSERYLIKFYRPNYLNPVRWQSRTNDRPFTPLFEAAQVYDGKLDKVEAAFQISFKTRVWASNDRRFGAWLAYTQQSFWQVYNGEISSPFRDTNYEPEIKLTWQPKRSWGGFDWQLLGIGYNHESNGRADPISRSWDRIVAEIGIEKGDFALLLRPWIRIDDDSDDSDNPDITDYYGHGDITAVYKTGGHSFTLNGRGNIGEKKGALRLTWMTPELVGPLRGYVTGFTGYGDTLLDYNFRQNAISVGFALNDLLDR
jgi:phospholipase A1